MALIFMDGFDHYGPPGQTTPTPLSIVQSGPWPAATIGNNGSVIVAAGLSSPGNSINLVGSSAGQAQLIKPLGANYSRMIGGVRFQVWGANNGVRLVCNRTPQVSINIANAGAITIRTGDLNGTVIATGAVTIAPGATHYLEWDITIGAAGAYQVLA